MKTCQIIHIPNKPPILPNQQPTVNVFASAIEPKFANTIIRQLNQVAPLENLRHVKRIQKKFLDGGKTQLSMILCLADENDNQMSSLPLDVQEIVNSFQLSPFIAKVCKNVAMSKEEWEEQCTLWPTSYHPPTYNIDGITGFSEVESQSIISFMKSAVALAKSGDDLIVNAAVIVDPSVNQVIASARDQFCCDSTCTAHSSSENNSDQPDLLNFHHYSNGVASHMPLPSNDISNGSRQSYGASCLNPWQWAQDKSHTTSCYWHPLRHATLAAIEVSSARDRRLFPSTGHVGNESYGVDIHPTFETTPAKKQKTDFTNGGEELDYTAEDFCPESDRPYLCTGYDIYLVWEPCVMCAMALVHQRVRRIFYAFPNPHEGALGSVHRIQGEKSLNHHYAVFRVLSDEILNTNEIVAARST